MLALVVGALPWVGCSGELGELPPPRADMAAAATATPPGGGLIDGDSDNARCTPGAPRPTTRFFRLTHHQYDNAIKALTGLDGRPSLDFPVDQNQAGFDRGVDLQVGEVLGQAYRTSAETVAEKVIADPAAYAKVVGCGAELGDACAQAFIAKFGRRAFRRPLSSAEQSAYTSLFMQGAAVVDGPASDFHKGVQVVLQALLQSPNFLYRVELSQQSSAGLVSLNGHELASRLSFSLLNQPPDDVLLDEADSGRLASVEAVAEQARRLLEMSAARDTLRDFHHQWLDLDTLPNKLVKDAKRYPSVTPALAPVLQEEATRFVEAVTFEARKGFRSLLTAPFAFVNRITAPLYGLSGNFTDALQRADLDPAQRAGLFTQLAFLADRAYTDQSSPIHRGVFIQRRVLCTTIPDPPANVPGPPALGPTQTTRQQVDTLTSVSPCSGCHHTLINPVGFGFEHYDAVGQYRSHENGLPVDASGSLAGTRAAAEGKANFSDAIGESTLIAESIEARRCYAANWTRYTLGREEDEADHCAIDALAAKLADDDYKVTDLLVDLTRTQAFMFRAAAQTGSP